MNKEDIIKELEAMVSKYQKNKTDAKLNQKVISENSVFYSVMVCVLKWMDYLSPTSPH